MVKLTYIDVIRDYDEREGASLEKEMIENYKKYVFIMPLVGLFVSVLLFVYFFGIAGVEEPIWGAALYCALPFLVNTILFLPLCIYFKVSKKSEEHT
ncbi:hypothetical protein M3580_13230 [Bacillus safensis]|uniref:hypothetical protein n=1 Tax=Bacillus safensis TaxID=561879 RepID=UPI00203FD407|nr:hypothetical protein [Bacillus safensis]MCM2990189.1 hypothetical protein [Bacillus safensis]